MIPFMDAESLGVALLIGAVVIPATLVYALRRDALDPRVCFPALYLLAVGGPVVYYLLTGWYHSGVKDENVPAVLLACSSAILCFTLGASLPLRGMGKETHAGRVAPSQIEARTVFWAGTLMLLFTVLSLILYEIWTYKLLSSAIGIGKTHYRAYAGEDVVFWYRKTQSMVVLGLFMLIAVATYRGTWRLPLATLVLLCTYGITCFAAGERDYLLLFAYWCAVSRKSMPRTILFAILVFSAALLVVTPITRTSGLGTGAQIEAFRTADAGELTERITQKAFTLGSTITVFTNVCEIIPARQPFWYGETFIISLTSFIPGDLDIKRRCPHLWFREHYYNQGVAGLAFSMDAEGYMNFGWFGPALVFFVWGWFLGALYRKATRVPTLFYHSLFYHYFSLYALMASIFAIRSDSRTLFKLIVFGALAWWLFVWLGHAFAVLRRDRPAVCP